MGIPSSSFEESHRQVVSSAFDRAATNIKTTNQDLGQCALTIHCSHHKYIVGGFIISVVLRSDPKHLP
jgi:hypothetical protein